MSTGTCLQDSWIQIIQVDIEGDKEIITRLQSGFISFWAKPVGSGSQNLRNVWKDRGRNSMVMQSARVIPELRLNG